MAREKKKWVAFRTNAIIPADVIGDDKDRKVIVGVPVHLPAEYADHVVHDRFADHCSAPKKTAAKPAAAVQTEAEAAQKRTDAQTVVDDITAKMSEMAETDDGWSNLATQLDEAQTALAALQPAA